MMMLCWMSVITVSSIVLARSGIALTPPKPKVYEELYNVTFKLPANKSAILDIASSGRPEGSQIPCSSDCIIRRVTIFRPRESGNYKFGVVCNVACIFSISEEGNYNNLKTLNVINSPNNNNPNVSEALHLGAGYPYMLEMVLFIKASQTPSNIVQAIYPRESALSDIIANISLDFDEYDMVFSSIIKAPRVGHSQLDKLKSLTVTFWLRVHQNQNVYMRFHYDEFFFELNAEECVISLYSQGISSQMTESIPLSNLEWGIWHHFSIIWDAAVPLMTLYQDGQLLMRTARFDETFSQSQNGNVKIEGEQAEISCFNFWNESLSNDDWLPFYQTLRPKFGTVKPTIPWDLFLVSHHLRVLIRSPSECTSLQAPGDVTIKVNAEKGTAQVSWSEINSTEVEGYEIVLYKDGDLNSGIALEVCRNLTSVLVTGIHFATSYNLSVSAFGPRGVLGRKTRVTFDVDEEAPNIVPSDVQVFRTSSTEVIISWEFDQSALVFNGTLRGFKVLYWPLNETEAIAETIMTCSELPNELNIYDLLPNTNYSFKMLAFSSVQGRASPVFHIQEEQVCNGSVENFLLFTEPVLRMVWEPPLRSSCTGIIRNYRLKFKQIMNSSMTPVFIKVPYDAYEYSVSSKDNLATGVKYQVSVAVQTSKSLPFGPESEARVFTLLDPPSPPTTSTLALTPTPTLNVSMTNSTASGFNQSIAITPAPSTSACIQSTAASGGWGEWGEWSACSTSCGDGARTRMRSRLVPSGDCGGVMTRNAQESEPNTTEVESCVIRECIEVDLVVTGNLTDKQWTDSLRVKNSSDFLSLEDEIVQKVNDTYPDPKVPKKVTVLDFRHGSVIATFNITFSTAFSQELLIIQEMMDINNTISGLSIIPITVKATKVPNAGPTITAINSLTTDSVQITWDPVKSSKHTGIPLLGYKINYRPLQNDTWTVEQCTNCTSSHVLEKLQVDTEYRFRLQAFTASGTGVVGPAKQYRTPVEAQIKALPGVRAKPLSSTQISVEWDSLQPLTADPGDLISHKIILTDKETGDVTQRTTNSWTNWLVVSNLQEFTEYSIKVVGLTKDGIGPSNPAVVAKTKEDVPSAPPDNMIIQDMFNISTIIVQWSPVPRLHRNGIIRGYRLEYVQVKPSGKFTPKVLSLPPNVYEMVVQELAPSTTYSFSLSAVTTVGVGMADVKAGATCKCPKNLQTNWWTLPPYLVADAQSPSPSGIFGPLVKQMIDYACGLCVNGHNDTIVHFQTSGLGRPAEKSSQLAVIEDIDDTTDISFPIAGHKDELRYMEKYVYLPLVQSPGIAFIAHKQDAGQQQADAISSSILACWPVTALFILMCYIVGVILWFTENQRNVEQFPPSFGRGAWEGAWFSFITMTTVGYGDRVPLSNAGRLVALVWTLIGLVVLSIFMGQITTSLTTKVVSMEQEIILYGTNVSALSNSTEYRVGILKNANMFGYSTMDESYKAVINGQVKGLLVDAYVAGSMSKTFVGQDVYVNRVIGRSLTYGIVLSGQAVRLESACREYIATHKAKITDQIKSNVKVLDLEAKNSSLENTAMDHVDEEPIVSFDSVLRIVCSLLGACVLMGLLWQTRFAFKAKGEIKPDIVQLKEVQELREMVCEFYKNFMESATSLRHFRRKHHRCLVDKARAREKSPFTGLIEMVQTRKRTTSKKHSDAFA
ncbi:uncharacterized protein LOC116604538 [Nematostella vectensis]|uniref:uncharacterized protein LOC116604538 n=1 Tax=Nematostella vectensis TaxID=45351 RepID=UPI002076D92C|nr:uncharacterized protein LOC116604538 [Nematostella vectensis]